jgi:hypothetical protein
MPLILLVVAGLTTASPPHNAVRTSNLTAVAVAMPAASGAVTAVTILSSSGYPDVDQALVWSIKARHYRPALLDGRPVAVWISDAGIRLAP